MTAAESLELVLPLFQVYYDITRDGVTEPFQAEAAFHSSSAAGSAWAVWAAWAFCWAYISSISAGAKTEPQYSHSSRPVLDWKRRGPVQAGHW